jgi:hypothetical protein
MVRCAPHRVGNRGGGAGRRGLPARQRRTFRDKTRHRGVSFPPFAAFRGRFPYETPVRKFFATRRDKPPHAFSGKDLYLTAEHAENAESFMAHRTNGVIPNVPLRGGGLSAVGGNRPAFGGQVSLTGHQRRFLGRSALGMTDPALGALGVLAVKQTATRYDIPRHSEHEKGVSH